MKNYDSRLKRAEALAGLVGASHDINAWITALAERAESGDLEAGKILTDLDQQWQALMASCPTDDLTPGERVAELARRSLQPGGGDIQQQFTRLLAIVQEGVALH